MATFNLGSAGDLNDLQQIKSYLFKLDRQLKYTFSNLDVDENFNERSKLIFAATEDIQATIEVALEGIRQTYATKDSVASIELTVDGISQSYVTKDGVAAAINLNEQGVKVAGAKIALEGAVSVGDKVTIDPTTGVLTAVDGSFTGEVIATSGSFAGTVRGGNLAFGGNSAANALFKVDSSGNLSIGAGNNPPFQVTNAGEVTATKLSITGGDSSIWLGGNAANPAFSVDKNGNLRIGGTSASPAFKVTSAGAVTATNLDLTGGSINLNNAFTVTDQGVVTIKSGSISLGEISGSNPVDYNFKVTSGGALTAKSATIMGSITTKGTGSPAPFMTLSDGVITGGKGSTQYGSIIFKDGITKHDPSTGTSSSVSAMTLQSPGTLLCGGVFTALVDNPGQNDPVYQGISRADSQHVITGTDSGGALIDIPYGMEVECDGLGATISYYPLQLQFINGLLVSCALAHKVTLDPIWW